MHEEKKEFSYTPLPKEGERIIDTVTSLGRTAIDIASMNKKLIIAISNVAGADSQISKASDTAKQLDAIQRTRNI